MDALRRALLIFVVGTGVVIVLATGALVWLLVERSGRNHQEVATAPPAFKMTDLQVPAGARLEDMRIDASGILLHLATPGGQDYLLLVDPKTGHRLGLMRLVPQPS